MKSKARSTALGSAVKIDESSGIRYKGLTTCTIINHYLLFTLLNNLRPSQQFFSYFGTGLPGFNQYSARINVSC